MSDSDENKISGFILDAAIEVHRQLGGPRLLESVYEEALYQEILSRKLLVNRQVSVPIVYKGINLKNGLRLDLLVANKVIVELKAAVETHGIYKAQLLTYLRVTGLKLGLLINFGKERVVDGFERVANRM